MAAETTPVALVFRSDDWIPEMVRFVVEAVPKYPVPETESAVEEAYANCDVEEAKRPVRNQAGVVVEFVPSKELVSEVRYVLPVLVKSVVEAWVKKVEEAMREKGEVLFNQSAVEVAFTTTLLYESVVNGKAEAICEGVA